MSRPPALTSAGPAPMRAAGAQGRQDHPGMIRAIFRKIKVSKDRSGAPAAAAGAGTGVAVVAIVRNEARHIGEWAGSTHAVGVRHFHHLRRMPAANGTQEILRRALPQDALDPGALGAAA